MNQNLGIYSGNCFNGICGEKTNLKDIYGNELFVGDMVVIYKKEDGVSLSAVLRHGYQTYTDGTVTQDLSGSYFVMGISSENHLDWNCQKVKSYKDCISGERWSYLGLNYNFLPEKIEVKHEPEA